MPKTRAKSKTATVIASLRSDPMIGVQSYRSIIRGTLLSVFGLPRAQACPEPVEGCRRGKVLEPRFTVIYYLPIGKHLL